ncbi:MAG: endoribonuclease [Ramlibacter sp.]|nr:endoribonuclease [Ramlibacter sp.]
MQFISAAGLAPPQGHYSPAVRAGGLVFLSGMLANAPAAGEPDSFEREVRAVFEQCRHVLAAADCGLEDVVQCTAYIVGIGNWPIFNGIYKDIFGDHKPARAVVPVPELHYGRLVEVQLVAAARS